MLAENVKGLKYRREIDGLRALAVIPVMLFHAGFEGFGGGFVGVDVFFVISGYLITSIILDDQERGRFNLLRFYERRARRILPALFVVMGATCVFAYAWMLPDELKNFGQSILATTLFSNNILLAITSNYWSLSSEFKPLLHTWSLGVEEQYYVLFPVILILGSRHCRRYVPAILALAALLSFAAANWGLFHKPELTFYLLPTRAWEILVGALTAFYMFGKADRGVKHLGSEILGGLGVCLILASIVLNVRSHPLHGVWYLVAPTIGTVLIILFSSGRTVVGRMLGWQPVVVIGLMSYSCYLWHQPLLSLARVYSKDPPGTALYVILLIVTFALAYLTWRFIETPCRSRGVVGVRTIAVLAFSCSIVFALFGVYLDHNYGIVSRLYDSSEVTAADLDKRIYNERVFHNKKDRFPSDRHLKLLVIGNSFGRDFVNMTTETFNVENVDIVYRDDLSECIVPFESKMAASLYNAADVIVYASGDASASCLNGNLKFVEERNKKLFYIGTKSFGYNENWIMRLQPWNRSNQVNRVLSESLEMDARVSDIVPRDNYISLLRPTVQNGYIPITDSLGRLLSIDRVHITRFGAIYFGQQVLWNSTYGEVLNQNGAAPIRNVATKMGVQ